MRVIACILLLITVLAGAFFVYCYYGAGMVIEGVAVSLSPAVDALGTYNQITTQLRQGTFLGAVYREVDFQTPEAYAFLTLTVRMSNRGLFPQDWIRIEVEPDAADIVQLFSDRAPSLAGMSRGDFHTTLLTHGGMNTSRGVRVKYYVLGTPFTVSYQMP